MKTILKLLCCFALSASAQNVQSIAKLKVEKTLDLSSLTNKSTVRSDLGVGVGTVTASGGALTANALVLGAGTIDTKVSTGITSNGGSTLNLGVSGSAQGQLVLFSIGGGSLTISAPTGSIGSASIFLPALSGDTLVGRASSDTLTNKTYTLALLSGGLTANGSTANDFSGSSGPFKSSTGAITLNGTSFKNIRHGISNAMSSGAVTVTDTGATASTRYFLTAHTLGTITVPVSYYVSARSAGTSFTITSANAVDTSTIDWLAIEP